MITRVGHGVMRILAGTGRYRYESGGWRSLRRGFMNLESLLEAGCMYLDLDAAGSNE
jgi:hypothetical protein